MNYLIRRFFAFYLDAIIAMVFIVIFEIVRTLLSGQSLQEVDSPTSNHWVFLQIISLFLYCFLFELFFKRTIGKIVLKFKIVGVEESLNIRRFIQVLKRTVSRFIPLEPFSIFLDENWEMWHDKFSKTRVVDIRKK